MKRKVQKIVSVALVVLLLLFSVSFTITASNETNLIITSSVKNSAYRFDNYISSLVIESSNEKHLSIGHYAFAYCGNLKSVVFMGEGDIYVFPQAFVSCPALEEITFNVNGTVYLYGDTSSNGGAFSYCPALKNISFENSKKIVMVGAYIFEQADIEELYLPPNVSFDDYDPLFEEYVDTYGTFENCYNLKKLVLECNLPYSEWHFGSSPNLKTIYVGKNVTELRNNGLGDYLGTPIEDFTIYGYTDSIAETYAQENSFKFIPVDSAEFNTITSTQSADATVGVPSAVTLSVAGFPESLKLESPLCSEVIFSREDAEIVTSETGELWTVDLIPMSEADTYTVTADYGLADLCATDEITIFAEEDTTPPVISVETATPAVMGEYAKVNVTVKNSPEAIRFVDDNVTTIARENAVITENNDNTETWEVNLLVTGNEQQLTVFAKDETGWLTQGTDFTLKAKVIDYSTEISDFAFEESLDGVIYNGMNTITLTTANGISKVQFMKNGNTWTYTEDTAEVIEVDGKKHWTIKMNFWSLGDQTYDIRVRTPKTTFEVTDTLNVTVYSR